MHENVLQELNSDRLSVLVVWMPILQADNRKAAEQARKLIPDPRARHFWHEDQSLGIAYGRTVDLPMGRDLAWDIYFVFDAGVEWKDETPVPTDWVHQLGRDPKHLGNGSSLRDTIESLLPDGSGS